MAFEGETFARRHTFQPQPELPITPIEKIPLPTRSRDALPPIRARLQWIGSHPPLKAELLALREASILAHKKAPGRTGLDRGQILVLGVVRLGLDADGDRMEDLANQQLLRRQRLGVPATPWGEDAKGFAHQPLRDNGARLDDAVLQESNARIAAAGRAGVRKKSRRAAGGAGSEGRHLRAGNGRAFPDRSEPAPGRGPPGRGLDCKVSRPPGRRVAGLAPSHGLATAAQRPGTADQ